MLAGQPVDQDLLLVRLDFPCRDRVVLVEHAGFEDEVGEIFRGHFRVLREGIGGVLRECPNEGAVRVPLHIGLEELAARALEDSLAGGVDTAQCAGVAVGQDDNGDIGNFPGKTLDRADPGELFVGAIVEQGCLDSREGGNHDRVAASFHDLGINGTEQWLGLDTTGNQHRIARFDWRRELDQGCGPFFHHWISHSLTCFPLFVKNATGVIARFPSFRRTRKGLLVPATGQRA